MITGAHVLLYSEHPEADREFIRDVLAFPGVDAGGGWMIFALPPAEVALHPLEGSGLRDTAERGVLSGHLYLMCDDVDAHVKLLADRGVRCAPIQQERWGRRTTIRLPSGSEIGLYQPQHPTALGLK